MAARVNSQRHDSLRAHEPHVEIAGDFLVAWIRQGGLRPSVILKRRPQHPHLVVAQILDDPAHSNLHPAMSTSVICRCSRWLR